MPLGLVGRAPVIGSASHRLGSKAREFGKTSSLWYIAQVPIEKIVPGGRVTLYIRRGCQIFGRVFVLDYRRDGELSFGLINNDT